MYSKRHINDFHVVDLSHIVSIDIPIWPEDPAVEVRGHASFETEGYALNEWSLGEHAGTHMNAPSAFLKDGNTIDKYEADTLVCSRSEISLRICSRFKGWFTLIALRQDIIIKTS